MREAKILEYSLHSLNQNDSDVKWDLWEVYDYASKHQLVKKIETSGQGKVPAYWEKKMIKQFARATAHWVENNIDFVDLQTGSLLSKPKSHWKWGPNRLHSPFNSFFQYQHITIKVHGEVNGNDLSSEFGAVKVRDITHRDGDPQAPINWRDIDVKLAEFSKLVEEIKKIGAFYDFSVKTHHIRHQNPARQYDSRFWISVYDDDSLSSALVTLRVKMSDDVQINVLKKLEGELVSTEILNKFQANKDNREERRERNKTLFCQWRIRRGRRSNRYGNTNYQEFIKRLEGLIILIT